MVTGSAVIHTPDQRLRVFVSSTLKELQPERIAAAEAIRGLKLTPVLFELGARPHPPRELYQAYLEQSHVFVGIYGEEYGWIAPGMDVSGLEDEYAFWGNRPALIYVKEPAPKRDVRLAAFLRRIEAQNRACYKSFSRCDELTAMLSDDLAVLLSERFETSGPATAARSGKTGEAPRSVRSARLRTTAFALAAATVAVILAIATRERAGRNPEMRRDAGSLPAERASVAVLPFVNMSADSEQDYFSDGLSEELLNALARNPELRVISRTSSFHFKGKNEDVRVIARQLRVANVLEGSVRKSGRHIRITAQLVDAATGSHLWSETYDRELDDIFAVQDDIARSVANASRVTILGMDRTAPDGRGHNADAYNLYLQAQHLAARGTREGLHAAVAYYDQALQLDPGRAEYWAGLASVHNRQASQGFIPVDEGFARSRAEVGKALALDPKLPDAHDILGYIRLTHDWDWEGADASYRQAVRYGPGSAKVLGGAANLAGALGRLDEALELYRRAIQLDPLNVVPLFNFSIDAAYAGRFDDAETAMRRVLELNPELPGAHAALARIQLFRANPGAAIEEIEHEPHVVWRIYGRALAYHALGRRVEADAALADLVAKYGEDAAFQAAEVYAFRHDANKAMEWLERAYAQRDAGLAFLKGDPFFRDLTGDPRYGAFLRKMRLSA